MLSRLLHLAHPINFIRKKQPQLHSTPAIDIMRCSIENSFINNISHLLYF